MKKPKRKGSSFAGGIKPLKPIAPSSLAANADAVIAISAKALTKLIETALATPMRAQDGGAWGPFEGSYDLVLNFEGGDVALIDPGQQINVDNLAFWGTLQLGVGLNLGRVLPRICVPPTRLCAKLPWIGEVCTPQVCVSWPSASVTIPLPITRMLISPFFKLSAVRSGDNWDIVLNVFPASILSLRPDLNYLIGTILTKVRQVVRGILSAIPVIGNLVAGLVDSVIASLRSVLAGILDGIAELIRQAIMLINLFSPTIPFKITSIPGRQVILPPEEIGDGQLELIVQGVSTTVANPEIQVAVNFS
ncbi:hypothetical protein [Rhizobium leguminosarum]|uniref:hypothetical protein n=1 Tax=Rhizobium leguminosarum TaxID=384 RepID=UPI0013DADFC8|nr:hypothetical protein [Rhizobium leguminosarum]NEK35065.1 hypothetical protein [Rhizobium leguminosarum]